VPQLKDVRQKQRNERLNQNERGLMTQSRWKSKAAWVVLIVSILAILGCFFTKETVSTVEIILMAVLVAAEAFGVFNVPTDKSNF